MATPEKVLDPEARIAKLLDDGNYELLLPRTDCGMVAATGLVKGNKVVVFASDPTIKGGALGIEGSQVIVQAYRAAMGAQVPVVGIWHLSHKLKGSCYLIRDWFVATVLSLLKIRNVNICNFIWYLNGNRIIGDTLNFAWLQ